MTKNNSIENKLKSFRVLARESSKTIINHIINANISQIDKKENKIQDLCMFCGTTYNLTKEHVIPRWAFENATQKFFTTNLNGLDQTYNKSTIPACSICNNYYLGSLEKYISDLFSKTNLDLKYFTTDELINIIRWLELIDFKFQILNARRVFKASKESGFIPYLAKLPLSVVRPKINYSPSKAIAEMRRSQKRVITKNKNEKLNSIIVFKSTNTNFHFLHTMDEFIFIELTQYNIALFYFYKRTFTSIKRGHKEAMKIIDQTYN